MKTFFSSLGMVVLVLLLLFGLPWILTGNSLALYTYFGPKFENTRRQVFEGTKSYNQGMIQELQNMQFEYEQADDSHKAVLGSLILHRVADYDVSKLPPDLYTFIETLKNQHKF